MYAGEIPRRAVYGIGKCATPRFECSSLETPPPGDTVLALLLALIGCTPEEPEFCAAETRQEWQPLSVERLDQYPDDLWTRPDPGSPTGLRVNVDTASTPWLLEVSSLLRPIATGVQHRSGFGRMGGVAMQFSRSLGEVPSGEALRFVDLSVDPPADVAYEARLADDGEQLLLQPLQPLSAGAQHAVVLTRAHVPETGACVAPSADLRALLLQEDVSSQLDHIADAYSSVAERLGLAVDDVSAATVFTTHDDLVGFRAIADDLTSRPMTWTQDPACEVWEGGRRCTALFVAEDHRGEGDITSFEARGTWELGVDLWLPAVVDSPVPLVLFGHGIDSSRGEARKLARELMTQGIAVVSIDAMEHGEHPARNDDVSDALALLGITLDPIAFNGLSLAQNFVQTSFDRLQLLELLHQMPDVDGDGTADLDMERIGYMGVSLGGLMGPGVMALGDDIDAGVLAVAGGHLATFAVDNTHTQDLRPLFVELAGSEAAWERLLLVGQSAMDPADPAVFAAHVFTDRLGTRQDGPHLLLPVSINDVTVPVSTGKALARSLALPHMPPVADDVSLLEVSALAPLEGNQDGLTAAFFQFDRVTHDGGVVPSSHSNTPWSPEGRELILGFFETWVTSEVPVVVDPYATLQTPPLVE